jgi:hypothetical protein
MPDLSVDLELAKNITDLLLDSKLKKNCKKKTTYFI